MELLDQHLRARKKYFEFYHRAKPQQLEKIEKHFYKTIQNLREYEDSIKKKNEVLFQKVFSISRFRLSLLN